MIWHPIRTKSGKTRFGALFWIALMLLGSATLRLGIEIGPAIAREAVIDPGTKQPETASPPQDTADLANRAVTSEELEQLFRELQSREAVLKEREMQIEDRMKALEIADTAIEEKMAVLIETERSLSETLALADGASEEDLLRLTTVYEQMKPKESAALFETMDPAFAAGFLGRMRSDVAAGIMANLTPQAAYTISVILAGRNANVPQE